jgi:hypothetical protein
MMLQTQWPNLTFIWPTDPTYKIITLKKLRAIVKKSSVSDFDYMGTVWDCDNFALHLHAMVQKTQYNEILTNGMEKIPWAFGECMGTKFRGKEETHAINIALTDKGIYLIEPQTDAIWKASKRDLPFFVKF